MITIRPNVKAYYITDHLGSIRTTIDQFGNVIGYDDYYPFGLPMPGRSSNLDNPNDLNKFTGHERDNEGGLMIDYMLARNYDPEIGRFMSVDPLVHKFPAWSPYNYELDNPKRFIDPDGRAPDDYFSHEDGYVLVVRNNELNRYCTENSENGGYTVIQNLDTPEGRAYLDSNQLVAKDLAKKGSNKEQGLAGGSMVRDGGDKAITYTLKTTEYLGQNLQMAGAIHPVLGSVGAVMEVGSSILLVLKGEKSSANAGVDLSQTAFSYFTPRPFVNRLTKELDKSITQGVMDSQTTMFNKVIDEIQQRDK